MKTLTVCPFSPRPLRNEYALKIKTMEKVRASMVSRGSICLNHPLLTRDLSQKVLGFAAHLIGAVFFEHFNMLH